MGQCPAKSGLWGYNFITIKIARCTKQHIFATVLPFLFKFYTVVPTPFFCVKQISGGFDHCFYQHAYGGFDIGCGQKQMALRIERNVRNLKGKGSTVAKMCCLVQRAIFIVIK